MSTTNLSTSSCAESRQKLAQREYVLPTSVTITKVATDHYSQASKDITSMTFSDTSKNTADAKEVT